MHTSEITSDAPVKMVEVLIKKDGDPSKVVNTPLDPLKVDPKDYKLEFENSQVRVIRVKMPAGQKIPLHEHMLNRVVVYLTDQARGKAGEVRLEDPSTHTEENPLDHPVERIAVDLK